MYANNVECPLVPKRIIQSCRKFAYIAWFSLWYIIVINKSIAHRTGFQWIIEGMNKTFLQGILDGYLNNCLFSSKPDISICWINVCLEVLSACISNFGNCPSTTVTDLPFTLSVIFSASLPWPSTTEEGKPSLTITFKICELSAITISVRTW